MIKESITSFVVFRYPKLSQTGLELALEVRTDSLLSIVGQSHATVVPAIGAAPSPKPGNCIRQRQNLPDVRAKAAEIPNESCLLFIV